MHVNHIIANVNLHLLSFALLICCTYFFSYGILISICQYVCCSSRSLKWKVHNHEVQHQWTKCIQSTASCCVKCRVTVETLRLTINPLQKHYLYMLIYSLREKTWSLYVHYDNGIVIGHFTWQCTVTFGVLLDTLPALWLLVLLDTLPPLWLMECDHTLYLHYD